MRHTVIPENAEKFKTWIRDRGGVAIWESVNLSNPGRSWSSPALGTDGTPYPKPSWESASTPARVITDEAEIDVIVPKVFKRFHGAVRMGSQGLSMKLTDGASRRLKSYLAKAGQGSWYEFDYGAEENVVILVPDKTVPLSKWHVCSHGFPMEHRCHLCEAEA